MSAAGIIQDKRLRVTSVEMPTRWPLHVIYAAASLVGLMLLSLAMPHPAWTVMAMFAYLVVVFRLMSHLHGAGVLVAPFVLLHLAVMLSLAAIESGAVMKELGLQGEPLHGGVSFAWVGLWFIATSVWVAHAVMSRWASPPVERVVRLSGPLAYLSAAIMGALVAYMLLRGAVTGFPLLSGTDRFTYRAATDVIVVNALTLKYVIGAFMGAGAALAADRRCRLTHQLVFISYLGVTFLFADKFFNILIAAIIFAAPGFMLGAHSGSRAWLRLLPAASVVIASVLAVTVYIYSGGGALSPAQTSERLLGRAAGQGQLWQVAVQSRGEWARFDGHEAAKTLDSLIANPAATFALRERMGPFYFIERYANSTMRRSFFSNSGWVTPTMVSEAYALAMFGYVGVAIVMGAMGAVLGGLIGFFRWRLLSGNPFMVLLPAAMFTQFIYGYTQGTLYSLLGLSTLKIYTAFFVVGWFSHLWLKRHAQSTGTP